MSYVVTLIADQFHRPKVLKALNISPEEMLKSGVSTPTPGSVGSVGSVGSPVLSPVMTSPVISESQNTTAKTSRDKKRTLSRCLVLTKDKEDISEISDISEQRTVKTEPVVVKTETIEVSLESSGEKEAAQKM